MELVTPRLRGEPMTAAHSAAVAALQQDPEYMAFMGGPRSDQGVADFLERNIAHWEAFGFGMWVFHDVDNAPTGIAGLRHLDFTNETDVGIGYGVAPNLWGRGLGLEMASACVDIARDTLKLASLVARADADNTASIAVMKKLGFTFEHEFEEGDIRAVQYRLLLVD
jgi:RimJ/RimL family protein N-acetyltransferase